MDKSVEIIVFGATGCTGKCTVLRLARLTTEKYLNISWAIAGRSKEKLLSLVKELSERGFNIKELLTIECDINNEESIKTMSKMTKVVINCTAPKILLSSLIVKTCIETGTHYVDLSGEMYHILNLYRDYYKSAADANVLVIPSCGFTTMPVETGLIYLEKQFKGTLYTVECFTEFSLPPCRLFRALIHNGRWTSLLNSFKTYRHQLSLWSEIFPEPIEPEPEEMKRSLFFRNKGRLWFPWPGIENDSVRMSQIFLNEKNEKKPLHFKAYTTFQFFYQFIVLPVILMYYFLSYFKVFRRLLISFPRLFTLGYVSRKGPTYTMRQSTNFSFILNGKGWELDCNEKSKPTKTLSVKVSGQDPCQDSTAIALIMSAITILKESSNMPKGGVITPGAAFFRTDIVDRLMHEGYTFQVLK
ncbi:unnamed protein product [Arctia plantaginis]|uniref:Saccharopine dehydrogenase NADP binding domain-containing protein n=1 Tax=Arctia plantaginis TaxID=874455 RepID=A0A8S0ZUL5_ARCPL|nr:unnamed protein product [Arctia plantaginis]